MPIQVPGGQLRPDSLSAPQPFQAPSAGDAQKLAATQQAQAAQAMGQLGNTLADAGASLYAQGNDAMSKQQAVLHAQELDGLLRDYQSKQGYDAYMGREAFTKAAGKLREKYAKSLQNDDQITLFNRMVDAQMATADGRATVHNTRETRAWNIQMTQVNLNKYAQDYQDAAAEDAYVEEEQPNSYDLYSDESVPANPALLGRLGGAGTAVTVTRPNVSRQDRMGVARAAMEAEYLKLQKLAGMDDKTAREAMKVSVQQLHGAAMKMLTDQDPKKARGYFNDNKDEMSAAQVTTITKQLDKLDTEDRALATVREAMASVGPDATPTERYQAVLDAAAKENDAEAYRLIVSFGNSELAQQQRIDNGRKNDLMEQAEVFIYAPENKGKTYEDLPPSMRENLEKNGLVDEVMDIVGGRDRRTQEVEMLKLLRNPDALKGMDLDTFKRTYRPRLSSADFNRALKAWESYNVKPKPKAVNDLLAYTDALLYFYSLHGLDEQSIEADPEKELAVNEIRREVQKMIDTGKLTVDMSYEAQLKTIGTIFEMKATIPGGFFSADVTKPVSAMTPSEQDRAEVTFITVDGERISDFIGNVPGGKPGLGDADFGVDAKIKTLIKAAHKATEGSPPPNVTPAQILRVWYALDKPDNVAEAEARVADPYYADRLQRAVGSDGAYIRAEKREVPGSTPGYFKSPQDMKYRGGFDF